MNYKINLRNIWSFIWKRNIIMTRSRIQMTVRNALVFPYFCTDPICNILLIHWVLIRVVFTRTGRVHIAAPYIRFQPEGKFR